jgi:phosphoribosylglycinamide formyltransferase 1
MLNIGVLVSGGGSNLKAIIEAKIEGNLNDVDISVVVSSQEGVMAIERAKIAGIPCEVLPKKDYPLVDDYDDALIQCFKKFKVDLVVMAGFLVILGGRFISFYRDRIINVHPSLIPSFCGKGYYGLRPHQKAIEYGVKLSGATVHFVEREADSGPIILQDVVKVWDDDTPETLQKRVMEEVEWKILPRAIRLYSEGRLQIIGRRVHIKEGTENNEQ